MWVLRLITVFVLASPAGAPQQEVLRLFGGFSDGWDDSWTEEQLGGRQAVFDVVTDNEGRALRVRSDGAATALFRPLDAGTDATIISWRWRVEAQLPGGVDEAGRSGDDYAARVFVIFGDPEMSRDTRALCYVWASRKATGSSYRSPVVDGVHTIVLQTSSGTGSAWQAEERNFVDDYRRAFGRDPDGVGAIAIMADTDDTGGSATAWFNDLVLR